MNNKSRFEFKLRFPEFEDKATWDERKLAEVLFEHKEKSTGQEEVFSVSVHKGIINQIEHLGRNFAASNTENYKKVFPGDLVYTKSPTGDFPLGIIKQSKVAKPVIVSPLYGVFRPETTALGVILDAYFQYPERTVNYLSSIVQKGAKNTINIHNETFLSKSLVLPKDKSEQQKIAACLSSLNDVITVESQKLELMKEHKKGLLQHLFPLEGTTVPRLRFKEFADAEEWKEKMLGEVAENVMYGLNAAAVEFDGENKYIRITDIDEDTRMFAPNPLTSPEGKIDEKYLVAIGDILFARTGASVGKSFLYTGEEGKIYFAGFLIRFRINGAIPYFVYAQTLTKKYQKWVSATSIRSGQPGINAEEYRLFSFLLPPDKEWKEQQKIAACLSSFDDLFNAQNRKVESLKLHRKGLLQGLFPDLTEIKE